MQAFKISSPLRDMPLPAPPPPKPTGDDHRWPDELPPPPSRPSPWRWLYVAGSFMFALTVAETDADAAARIGVALATVLGCAAAAAAFYVWRASTRPAIPATTFILAFLFTGISLADRKDQRERAAAELQEAASRFATGLGPADTPPMDVEARIAWASQWALSDLAEHYDRLARSRGIDPSEYPEQWFTARYAADAGDHPQVRRYFAAYQGYLAEADSTTREVYTDRYQARLREAGYDVRQAALMASSIPTEAEEAMKSRREDFELSGRLAASALALHDYLVRTDARAHYDADVDVARFDRNAERRRASSLHEEVRLLIEQREVLRAASHAAWQEHRQASARRYR